MRNKLLPPLTGRDPRGTGRTTAAILRAIAEAIAQQGTCVLVKDHENGLTGAALAGRVRALRDRLELRHFRVDCVVDGVVIISEIWGD